MKVKLLERGSQPGERREVPVTKDEFLIGRGSDCDLCLQTAAVSRHHCLLRVRGDEVALVDLGSSNGTYLNGLRVRSQATLHDADEITIGTLSFLVELADQGGINWGSDPNADPNALTTRLPSAARQLRAREQEKDRAPKEPGGREGAAG